MTDAQLLSQIQNQYTESRDFLYTRKLRQVRQLQLLNNLRRGDENIASKMLFTFFNRVMSNLYEHQIQIKFVPSEEMDYKKIEALNKLAVNDFREMDMALHQYDWTWDTLFFGRGLIETGAWNKKKKMMTPRVINPLAFGSDPFFASHQQWRYYWKWVLKPGFELQKLIKDGVIDGVKNLNQIPNGYDADLWNFKVQRDQAKVLTSTSDASLSNTQGGNVYQILEIYTTDNEGNKMVAWVDKGFGNVLMKQKLDLRDEEEGSGSKWPLVVKELFREPHSSVSFSIPDLIEDMHRAESVLMNLAYIAAKDEANPIYKYNPNKVKDVTQLFQRQISQHIPVDDMEAVQALQQHPALSASLLQFLGLIKSAAQDPIGTGMTFQPIKKGNQTATEASLQQQVNDLAQSLQSRVLQIGEKEFWEHWYNRYLRHTKEGDEKIIAVTSVTGVSFESIKLGDIRTKSPPKVDVYSAKEAEYKELVEKRDMMQLFPQFAQTLEPGAFRNWQKYLFLPKLVKDSSTIDLIIPQTLDEIDAERENEMMRAGMLPEVRETDDDETHLYVHAQENRNAEVIAHEWWHREMLAVKKKKLQDQAAAMPPEQPPEMNQLNVGAEKRQPMGAAVPLTQEMRPKTGKVVTQR